MSQIRGIDTAWQHPDYQKVREVGYTFVFRYLSRDPSKNLTPEERDLIHAQGLAIGLVWEAGAADWQDVATAVAEAREAVSQAQALGVPSGVCIYAANDANATPGQVAPGFVAARPIIRGAGFTFGCYAGDSVTDALQAQGVTDFGWQAAAASWGDGKVSAVANVFQRTAVTLPNCGGSYDEDVLLKSPAGMWVSPQTLSPVGPAAGAGPALPVPAAPSPPGPVAPPWPGRDLRFPPMVSGADVRVWQAQMAARGWRIVADGFFGPASESVCRQFQQEKGLLVDGVVGPVTWAATWLAPVTP